MSLPPCQAALEHSPEIVLVISATNVVYASPVSLERILGLTAHSVVGSDVADLLHPDDSPALMRDLASEDAVDIARLCRLRATSGEFIQTNATGRRYQIPSGDICYILSIRPCELGSLDLQFLAQAVDLESLVFKISEHGLVIAQFIMAETPFLELEIGANIFSCIGANAHGALANALTTPLGQTTTSVIPVNFQVKNFQSILYFTILRFSERTSFLSISKVDPGNVINTSANIIESEYLASAAAIQLELEQIELENAALQAEIQRYRHCAVANA